MGQPTAVFGRFLVRTTPDLAKAIRAGAVWETEMASLERAWREVGLQDHSLYDALEMLDRFRGDARKLAAMEKVVATLLEDPTRADHWRRAVPYTTGVIRFHSAGEVTANLTETLLRRSGNSAQAYVGGSTFARNRAKKTKPTLQLSGPVESVSFNYRSDLLTAVGENRGKKIQINASQVATADLPEVFQMWNQLADPATADRFASLELLLPHGIRFRYGEFPNEKIGKSGTIIELGEATAEQFVEVACIFKPAWFQEEQKYVLAPHQREKEPVRFVFPSDIGQRVADWDGRTRASLIQRLEAVWKIVKKKLLGQAITPADEDYLRTTRTFAQREHESFLRVHEFWGDVRFWALRVDYYNDRTMNSAIHNAERTADLLVELKKDLLKEMGDFERATLRGYDLDRSDKLSNLFLTPLLWVGRQLGFKTERKLGITIEVDNDDRLRMDRYSLADDFRLQAAISNAVINLLTNAIRYADDKKAEGLIIKVTVSKLSNGSLMVTVADNGIGIESHHVWRLGLDDFRVEQKPVEGSHGKGLASVVATLAKVGVPLWVRSGKGVGSEFRFILPAQILTRPGVARAREPAGSFEGAQLDLAQAIPSNAQEGFVVPASAMQGKTLDHFVRLAEEGNLSAAINLLWVARENNVEAKKVFARLRFDKIFEGKSLGDVMSKLAFFQIAPGVGVIRFLAQRMEAGDSVELARAMMKHYRVTLFQEALEQYVLTPEAAIDALVTLIEKGGNTDAITLLGDLDETGHYTIPFDRIDVSELVRRVNTEKDAKEKGKVAMALVSLATRFNDGARAWLREVGGVHAVAEMLPSPFREIYLAQLPTEEEVFRGRR